MIGIATGAAALGLTKVAGPTARDAAMDIAFGDPNADTTFLGRKLTPGAMFDAIVPGDSPGGDVIGMSAGLGSIGALGGGLVGASMGLDKYRKARAAAGGTGSTVRGIAKAAGSFSRGTLIGSGIGVIAGLGIAAGLGSAYINRNERLLRESPYVGNRRLNRDMTYGGSLYSKKNTSLQTAQDLNADGNIVLGMHNLRRGG
jgi:hypothetical protein